MDESRRESIGDGNVRNGELIEWFKSHDNSNNDKVMIATYLQTQTEKATHLCIHDPARKLLCETDNGYTIGGTYNGDKEEFWFFTRTSLCHGNNYLLNLFVTTRTDLRFSICIPSIGHNLTDLIHVNEAEKCAEITGLTKEFTFTGSTNGDVIFLKAFRFTKADIDNMGGLSLLVPCSIEIHYSYKINQDLVNNIKLQYTVQLNEALFKDKAQGEFILESATHKKYPVHLLVAAAHSAVLRKVIKENKKSFFLNFGDEDVEMLIWFLYNGSIENLMSKNGRRILDMADMLELPGMLELGQAALSADINVENAIEITILAKKYNLKELLLKVFHFIKHNPELLLSGSIEHLNDIDLMRTMLQHIGNSMCQCEGKKKKPAKCESDSRTEGSVQTG